MCKTRTTNWDLLCERLRAKKRKNNGVGAAVTAEEGKKAAVEKKTMVEDGDGHVYHTTGAVTYRSLDVAGGGMCGLLTLIALYMIFNGEPYAFVFAVVNGEVTSEMRGYVQCLRGIIVHMSNGRITHLGDGEESAPFDDVVDNPDHEIKTKGMWKKVTLATRGYLDGLAMVLLSEYFGLDGFRIIRASGDGLLVGAVRSQGSNFGRKGCPPGSVRWVRALQSSRSRGTSAENGESGRHVVFSNLV